jgi:hypothetical protein
VVVVEVDFESLDVEGKNLDDMVLGERDGSEMDEGDQAGREDVREMRTASTPVIKSSVGRSVP